MKNDDSMIDDDALQPQGSPKIPLWVLSHYPRYVPLRLYGCVVNLRKLVTISTPLSLDITSQFLYFPYIFLIPSTRRIIDHHEVLVARGVLRPSNRSLLTRSTKTRHITNQVCAVSSPLF